MANTGSLMGQILAEFAEDVRTAYRLGDTDEFDRQRLADEWPDLLATFDQAIACLKGQALSTIACLHGLWRCRYCGESFSTADWSYGSMAESGTPMCDTCDCEMDLVRLPADTESIHQAANAWIIVDLAEPHSVSKVHYDFGECNVAADAVGDPLVVGIHLPEQRDGSDLLG